MASKDQGRIWDLKYPGISTYHNSNIIGRHRNAILPEKRIKKVSKPGLETASKPNFDKIHYAKFLVNEPLDININTLSYNFSCK